MSNVILTCKYCGKKFERSLSEHNRSVKLGRNEFCSLSCSTKWGHKNSRFSANLFTSDNRPTGIPNNKRDKYTPFRYFRHSAKRRHNFELTLEYLKNLWEKQDGICPFTGWKMELPLNVEEFEKPRFYKNASLDRINNKKGYVEGNVRFVCYIANLARNCWDDDVVQKFAEAVVNNK